MKINEHNPQIWKSNDEKILNALRVTDRITELSKLVHLSRNTVQKHLKLMVSFGIVAKDGSRYKLRPFWPMSQDMADSVSRGVQRFPGGELQVELTSRNDPMRVIRVNQNGKCVELRELVRTSGNPELHETYFDTTSGPRPKVATWGVGGGL